MQRETGRPQQQSLGAWLATLRPGDPCPWCGGSLKASDQAGGGFAGHAGPSASADGGAALTCCRCGSEVDAGDGAAYPGCVLLDHAA
jgi:hypothetical protein